MEGGGGGVREPLSINQEDSHDTEVRNSNHGNFLLLLHIFADLIIGEVVGPLSPDHPFCRFTLRCRCPKDQTIKVTTISAVCGIRIESLAYRLQGVGFNDCLIALHHLGLC